MAMLPDRRDGMCDGASLRLRPAWLVKMMYSPCLNHPEGETSAPFLLVPPRKEPAEVDGAHLHCLLPSDGGVRGLFPPPPLLARLAREGREHGLLLRLGVLPEVLVRQHLLGRRPAVRVQS